MRTTTRPAGRPWRDLWGQWAARLGGLGGRVSPKAPARAATPATRPATTASSASRLGAWQGVWARLRAAYGAYGSVALPLALGASVRGLVFALAAIGAHIFDAAGYRGALLTWQRWDADWYMSIAAHGYSYSATGQSSVNFFPLYPLTVWLVAQGTRLVPYSHPYLLAGMLVSWLAFLAACVVLYRLVLSRFDRQTAALAVLLLSLFPFSYYFGAPFSESLYLLVSVAAFLGIERRQWWWASAAALASGAVRPPGLIVGACVCLAYALDWARTRHALRWDVVALALTPLGTAGYTVYCWLRFHDPLAYAKTSAAGWHGGHLQIGAIRTAWRFFESPAGWLDGGDIVHVAAGIYVLLGILFLLAVVPVARRLGPAYALYTLAALALPIATYPALGSLGRYLSVAFPVFIVLAAALRGAPVRRELVVAASALFLGLFAVLFASGARLP